MLKKIKTPRKSDVMIKRLYHYEGECPYCDFFASSDNRKDVMDVIWEHILDEECYK